MNITTLQEAQEAYENQKALIIKYQTELNILQEEEQKLLETMQKEFNVDNLDELRELLKKEKAIFDKEKNELIKTVQENQIILDEIKAEQENNKQKLQNT